MSRFYGACQTVLSPSSASDERLERLGIDPHRIVRWDRGVDLCRFSPELRDPRALPGEINVLYAGRLAREKGIDRLAEAFELAHRHDAFMFASRTDTFGQVILEAQASRLPVVAQHRMAEGLRRGGLTAVRERTWESALQPLADGYDKALELRTGSWQGSRREDQ
jgi:glycosyltransferase involved in cell wall biosynthesis